MAKTIHSAHAVSCPHFCRACATGARAPASATSKYHPPYRLTPADEGVIAAALDDASRAGRGDDDCVDAVAHALIAEAGLSRLVARSAAYQAVRA